MVNGHYCQYARFTFRISELDHGIVECIFCIELLFSTPCISERNICYPQVPVDCLSQK